MYIIMHVLYNSGPVSVHLLPFQEELCPYCLIVGEWMFYHVPFSALFISFLPRSIALLAALYFMIYWQWNTLHWSTFVPTWLSLFCFIQMINRDGTLLIVDVTGMALCWLIVVVISEQFLWLLLLIIHDILMGPLQNFFLKCDWPRYLTG